MQSIWYGQFLKLCLVCIHEFTMCSWKTMKTRWRVNTEGRQNSHRIHCISPAWQARHQTICYIYIHVLVWTGQLHLPETSHWKILKSPEASGNPVAHDWLQLGSSRDLVAILRFTGDSHTLEINSLIFGTSGTVKKMQHVRFLLWYFWFFGCEITITFMSARIFRRFWEKVSPFDCQFLGKMYPFPSPARILIQRPCCPYVLMGVPSSIVTIS